MNGGDVATTANIIGRNHTRNYPTHTDMSEGSVPDPDRRLDVREIAGEPFGPIMEELDALQRGERLLLINSFDPEPLYDVLDERGFETETTRVDDAEWHIVIEHTE